VKRETLNYFAVGLVVLTALVLLLFVLHRISSRAGEHDAYYTYYPNVAGIANGTQVTYEGYVLGYVAGVEPEQSEKGTRYQVELRVRKDWRIPQDSVAQIHAQGLLADTVVNINEGASTVFLSPGDVLQGARGADLLAAMGEMAREFEDLGRHTLRPLLESLNNTAQQLGSDLGSRVPDILDDVQALVGKLDKSATHLSGILNSETEQKAQRIITNVDTASSDFRALTTSLIEVKDEARRLVGKLDSLASETQPDIRDAVADLRHLIQQVSRYSDDILRNLDSTSRNVNEFSRQIRANPRRLISAPAPRDEGVRRE
jgi:phospholipid/cholesterol/gamma-HCH transport system substrate-binding protein